MNRSAPGFLAAALCTGLAVYPIAPVASAQSTTQGNAAAAQPDKVQDVNAAVVAARAATKDKRYADAEALMLKVTQEKPELVVPWVELGLAQLGLKKYPEAETSFKTAIGLDPVSQQRGHSDDFYQQAEGPGVVAPTATHQSRNLMGGTVNSGKQRTPDVLGGAYASLGEIYIHDGKVAEAQGAFDAAVQSNPSHAALYRGNETIFFFQGGNTDAQLAAAEKAIAVDPERASLYYFKGQALASKATMDPKTQKLILPPGCVEAYRKYLQLDPKGQFAADAGGVIAAADPVAPGKN
jgi:tetratricopeptide (TPR) repeat protein